MKPVVSGSHRWRTRYVYIRLNRYINLAVSIRRFKTAKSNRSQKFNQIVIPIYISSIKEIAIRQKKYKRLHRTEQKLNKWLPRRAYISTFIILLGIIGVLFFGLQTVQTPKLKPAAPFSLPAPKTDIKITDSKPSGLSRSEPTRIRIPRIGIDTGVIPVGRLADGTMETPPVLQNTTGWYKFGPTPGEIGPSIIVGHVDSYRGIAVFWRLREILPADEVEITRSDGQTVTFKVEALKQFDQDNFPTQEVYGNTDYAGLRLITCGGTFSRQTGHYSQNIVVFATITK